MLIVIIQPYINSLNLQAYHNKYHIESKVTSIFMIMFMCAYTHTHIHARKSVIAALACGCPPGGYNAVSEPANGFYVVSITIL